MVPLTCLTFILFIFACGPNEPTQAARILAVLPAYWPSHQRFYQPVLGALSKAGHDVTVYSPFKKFNPQHNYTEIILDDMQLPNDKFTEMIIEAIKSPHLKCYDLFPIVSKEFLKHFLAHENVQQLLDSKEHYDLVIGEFLATQEFLLVLGHIFKAPVIALQAYFTNNIVNNVMGNDLHISFMPDCCAPFHNQMSFLERALNVLYSLRNLHFYYYHHLPEVEELMKKKFPEIPPLIDMVNNISLVFVNDHLTADYAHPRPPNIIPVAGIHIQDRKPLPQDIQTFMDKATSGVIFYSLGTYIPDYIQPEEYFVMMINVFKNLPQRVLWKNTRSHIEGLPDNVKVAKWFPQRDVLAHPNCILFITHGGLLSQHETIHNGVPVVAIPQLFDQHRNARFYEHKGVGLRIEPGLLTETTLPAAIKEVIGNPMYKENMKKLSTIFHDRPLTPQQSVVFWTQWVLHHGAGQLAPAAKHLAWYQHYLLDVLAAVLVAILLISATTYWIIRKLIGVICRRRGSDLVKKKIS